MPTLGPAGLARRLRGLDRETFASFVAAVWSASGWSTEVDGPVVTARRGEDVRVLFVLPPRRLPGRWRSVDPPDVVPDVVVTHRTTTDPAALPRGTPDAVVLGAADLRERLFHAVPGDERRRIAAEFLDVDLGERGRDARVWGHWNRRSRCLAGVVAVCLLAVGFVVAGSVIGGGLDVGVLGPDDGPGEDRGVTQSVDIPSGEPAEPTCDRPPRAVVDAILTTSTKVHGADGPVTLWRFSDPAVLGSTQWSTFESYYSSIQFDLLWRAEAVAIERVERRGDEATVVVTAEGPNGPGTYAFELVRTDVDGQSGCWRVARLRGA